MDIRTEIVSPANEQYKIALRAFKRPEGGPEVGAATPVYAENAVCAPCVNADSLQEFEQLVEAIEAAGVDITSGYNDWYKITIAIANIFI